MDSRRNTQVDNWGWKCTSTKILRREHTKEIDGRKVHLDRTISISLRREEDQETTESRNVDGH